MKARTLCVWFPMWSLATARQTRHDAPSDEPLLIVDDRVTGATADVLEESYRITVSPEQAKALREGTQVWAKAGKGDASLRLRDAATGKPMPEAKLEKVRDSARSAANATARRSSRPTAGVTGPATRRA